MINFAAEKDMLLKFLSNILFLVKKANAEKRMAKFRCITIYTLKQINWFKLRGSTDDARTK